MIFVSALQHLGMSYAWAWFLSQVASLLLFWFSWPRTPWAANDPATIAAESVASNTNVDARRRERSRSNSHFIAFNDLVRRPA